jgi:hypothetical protein
LWEALPEVEKSGKTSGPTVLQVVGEKYKDAVKYTSYEVTVSLEGKRRSYRAMALHFNPGRAEGKPKTEILDNITSDMNAVLAERSPRVRSPWARYVRSNLYLAIVDSIRAKEQAGAPLTPVDAPIGYLPGDDAEAANSLLATAADTCTEPQPCSVSIMEETISPGRVSPPIATLPVRNPATIRRGFAPVFEATPTPSNCPVTWSITSGPGSIIGATNSRLATVNGDSVSPPPIIMRATVQGGAFAEISVPVVNIRNVKVRAYIVRRTDGTFPATTQTRVDNDIAIANAIWVQCGIRFTLESTSFINNSTYLNPNFTQRNMLCNENTGTGAIEIYYVDSFFEGTFTGDTGTNGVVINDGGNGRTAAHELGHAMGLTSPNNGHRGTAHVSLMWDDFSPTKADLILDECNRAIITAST